MGGTVVRAAGATDWGGYSGVFTDPDGHRWEVAHNPFWPLDDNGRSTLPE
ncbi:MAG: VOC family protein [Pseudonocardiaceae bacterium]